MLADIVVLDAVTAGQIAAGEVVERPVSAVKELVENALDAGATRVTVDLTDGGLSKIVVTDNGSGISPKNAGTAFLRHATSKIKNAEDLLRVQTLGFRGEALPSIAAVSKVVMTTRTHDELTGVSVGLEGGSPAVVSSAGCAAGTRVEISDIFYNTPVRRKSMKSSSVEGGLCSELLSKIALSRPDVRFDFLNGGRRVFFTPGSGKLEDAMAAVYGAGQAKEMLSVSGVDGDLSLTGYVGKPSLSRSNRGHQTIIVNGRYVRCPLVVAAVEKEYRNLLPPGRRPVVILSLSVATDKLDVNVHPAKQEVRLLEERRVAALVTSAIRNVMRGNAAIPAALTDKNDSYRRFLPGADQQVPDDGFFGSGKAATSDAKGAYSGTQLSGENKQAQPAAKKTSPDSVQMKIGIDAEPSDDRVDVVPEKAEQVFPGKNSPGYYEAAHESYPHKAQGDEGEIFRSGPTKENEGVRNGEKSIPGQADAAQAEAARAHAEITREEPAPGAGAFDSEKAATSGATAAYRDAQPSNVRKPDSCDNAEFASKMPKLYPLSQMLPVYILAEGEDGLYIIDQHAAHERVLYEECLAGRGDYPSQYLLIPETLELEHGEAAVAVELLPEFNRAGFVIDHFGGNTFLLRGAPSYLPVGKEKELFRDMLDFYKGRGDAPDPADFLNRLAASVACKGAVKAGERMPFKTMETLLERLSRTENPYTCPHGRPTVIHLSHRDLRARFLR